MRLRAIVIGIVCGLALGGGIGILYAPHRGLHATPATPLAENSGKITRVVMQYSPAAGAKVTPIYTQFLAAAAKDVDVVWVVGQAADLTDLQTRMGAAWPVGRCHVVITGKPISTWSKDRFVTLSSTDSSGTSVLCAPVRNQSANPLRTNDQEVPYRLAQDAGNLFGVRESEADFDGGDFLATDRHFFVSPALLEKNPQAAGQRFHSAVDLTDYLSRNMSAKITWLGESTQHSPPHHIGMYLTVMGNTAAVGDVRLAENIIASHPEILSSLHAAGGIASADFRADLGTRLDFVARQLASLGYRVVRVPLLPSATPKAWLSYNNGIVEMRDGTTIFYMPTFGASALDAAAAAMFRQHTGCTVIPIDCSKVWPLGGSLHCLVSVVRRTKAFGKK